MGTALNPQPLNPLGLTLLGFRTLRVQSIEALGLCGLGMLLMCLNQGVCLGVEDGKKLWVWERACCLRSSEAVEIGRLKL